MNNKLRWLFPAFWGVLTLATIRLAGDIYSKELFWKRPIDITLSEIIFLLFMGYLLDYIARKQLDYIQNKESQGKKINKILEYAVWELILCVLACVAVFILHVYAHYTHRLADYVIAMMMAVLCGTFMYMAIRNSLTNERIRQQNILLEQLKSEHLETELRLLKSQYHPHFLFNALNTIYFQIEEKNALPRYTIEKLSDLLRYQLYTIDEKVDISQELAYVTSYIELMKMRKSESLKLDVQIDHDLNGFKIYPLLFQPLVENAFKYVGGDNYINISLKRTLKGLDFTVCNSISNVEVASSRKGKGLGIENLKKRLDLLYPDKYQFVSQKDTDKFTACLSLNVVA